VAMIRVERVAQIQRHCPWSLECGLAPARDHTQPKPASLRSPLCQLPPCPKPVATPHFQRVPTILHER
jgi:hypothetical protein